MKRSLRICSCALLCLLVLTGVAFADLGPKASVTIRVVNAPEGIYYLDLLTTRPGDHCWLDPEGHDPALLEGLRSWAGEGWYPALSGGTPVPMSGSLTPDDKGNFRFGYFGLPDTFRIAVSGPDGAKATAEPFTRTRFYTHLTYGSLIKEEKMDRRVAYALCANVASYAAGYLPLHWLIGRLW